MRSNCPTVRYYVALNVCAEIERRVKKRKSYITCITCPVYRSSTFENLVLFLASGWCFNSANDRPSILHFICVSLKRHGFNDADKRKQL